MSLSNEYLAVGNCDGSDGVLPPSLALSTWFTFEQLAWDSAQAAAIKLKELQNSDSKYVTMTQDILGSGPFSLPRNLEIFQSVGSVKVSRFYVLN